MCYSIRYSVSLIGIIFGQLLDDFNSATCNTPDTSESASQSQNSVNDKILLILYLAIAQFVTIYIHLSCWSLNGARLAQRLREKYIRNLLRQEPSYFDSLPLERYPLGSMETSKQSGPAQQRKSEYVFRAFHFSSLHISSPSSRTPNWQQC